MTRICRILLIDDSPDDRADFRQMLLRGSNLRYQFTEADMGSTALQKVRGMQDTQPDCKPFDCILLDYQLPDMNAPEVLAALCDGSDLPPCPVVIITGWNGSNSDDGPRMLRAGAQDYIGKSWTTSESLTRTIENSIERFDLLTKRKIAEAELRQSEQKLRDQAQALSDLDQRKNEFLAMLSHELRNPLAPISNAVHLLRLHKNEDAVQQQARLIIERQVGQLNHLVDDLLEVSRITTGRVQLRQDQIAINGVVDRAIETAHPLIVQRHHELKVSLPPEPIWLHADAARLEQVVVNLLTNAAKYTDEGGRIELDVRQEGDSAVLRVRDTGIGIAPEQLPRMFELFTQAERSLDRSQGGLGIGLNLVQRLVELHGGTVEAHSVVGQGSEFTVRLPVMLDASAPSLPQVIEAEAFHHAGKRCRVLVVDDNVDAAQTLTMLLELSGYEVQMAHDGFAALQAALAWHPDVLLLDIGLPGLSGFEVAKQIRQEATLKNIVLVALTGYGQEIDRQRSQKAGFDHHLVKPADFEDVENILKAAAEKTI